MELETSKEQAYDMQLSAKKPKIKIGTMVIGIMLIAIPILITLFMTMPELWQGIMSAKGEIIKGAVIGLSTLPVLLFVVIKGGNVWYRKWWAWVACGITVIAVVAISLLGTTSMAPTNDMGRMEMQMGEGM